MKTKQKQMPPKSTSKKIYLESHAQKGRCNDVYKRFPMILKNKNVLIQIAERWRTFRSTFTRSLNALYQLRDKISIKFYARKLLPLKMVFEKRKLRYVATDKEPRNIDKLQFKKEVHSLSSMNANRRNSPVRSVISRTTNFLNSSFFFS